MDKVLVLAPHTDDGELGCGGTIARFIEEGKEVYCVAFSIAEESMPEGFPKNALLFEFKNAMNVLGIKESNQIIFRYPVREFPKYRQSILQDIIDLRNSIKPDLILVPSLNDIHQDHGVIAKESLRAFKKNSILGYELPWNNIIFETRCFIKLEHSHLSSKVQALKCYKSQNHRAYLNDEFIFGLAKTRGTQFETEYAESFEVIRWII